jgi:hypothetical protein
MPEAVAERRDLQMAAQVVGQQLNVFDTNSHLSRLAVSGEQPRNAAKFLIVRIAGAAWPSGNAAASTFQ